MRSLDLDDDGTTADDRAGGGGLAVLAVGGITPGAGGVGLRGRLPGRGVGRFRPVGVASPARSYPAPVPASPPPPPALPAPPHPASTTTATSATTDTNYCTELPVIAGDMVCNGR